MISHQRQNMWTIVSIILIITLPMIGLFTELTTSEGVVTIVQGVETKQFNNLNLEPLLNEAQLIILGRVLDEKHTLVRQPGTVGPAQIVNHTVFVEKVISGTYHGDTIGVVDGLHKNERVFLFLLPIFSDMDFGNNDYRIANFSQGKFEIDNDLLVHGANIDTEGMTVADFEEKINEALSKSTSNDTEADYYRNDTDLIAPLDW